MLNVYKMTKLLGFGVHSGERVARNWTGLAHEGRSWEQSHTQRYFEVAAGNLQIL